MKYSIEETLKEVEKRKANLVRERRNRAIKALSGTCFVLLAMVAAVIYRVTDVIPVKGRTSNMGAFLLPAEAGAYVLAAVLAFLLGIAFTVLILLYKRKHDDSKR